MTPLRFKPPTTAVLVRAAAECARIVSENPAMSEALAANAALVAASARVFGFRAFRDARSVLRRLTAAQIADFAKRACEAGMPDGGIDGLKKSSRARRLSGCGGAARDTFRSEGRSRTRW